jgi:hypothetical protein
VKGWKLFGHVVGAGLLGMVPILGVLINLAFQWLAMMVPLSILTTLYGIHVKGSALV